MEQMIAITARHRDITNSVGVNTDKTITAVSLVRAVSMLVPPQNGEFRCGTVSPHDPVSTLYFDPRTSTVLSFGPCNHLLIASTAIKRFAGSKSLVCT